MCLFNFLTNYDSLTCKNEVGLKGNRKTFVIKCKKSISQSLFPYHRSKGIDLRAGYPVQRRAVLSGGLSG